MGKTEGVLSLEEQLVELQNRLICQKVDEVKEKIKLNEMSERADFYENLHNHEKRTLYDLELENVTLKDSIEQEKEKLHDLELDNITLKDSVEQEKEKLHESELENVFLKDNIVKLKTRVEELEEKNVDQMGIKALFKILIKRIGCK